MSIVNETEFQPRQVRHWVADRLRNAILEGLLKPGEWLRQERLAQEYGVSQMPIREALKELQAEGLVEHVPYRGVRVVEFSADDVEDLYTVRSHLEGMAAAAAAKNITAGELLLLRNLHQQMAGLFDPENLSTYRELNKRFHLTFINASRRAYLIRTLTQMWYAFPTMLWSNFTLTSDQSLPERDADDLSEHEAILKALEAHDSERAASAARRHIENAGRHLVSVLRHSTNS